MTTAVAPERHFEVFPRAEIREDILSSFRTFLSTLTNPTTGALFTEVEIASATARQSRWYMEADSIDLVLLAAQNRDLFFADQVRIDRAGTAWLENYWGPTWGEDRLPASGGSGPVNQPAVVGTIFKGSTTIPDQTAYVMTAPDGKRFQCMFDVTTPASGTAALTLRGIDTGTETNVASGTKFKSAENVPAGVVGDATASAQFTGGGPQESDAAWAKRILDRIKHKPAAGNSAHFRAWAREASSSVEDAFVYAAALHAGSVIVVPTQKRSTALGPTARIPSAATLADVTAHLTPPGSPVVPTPPLVLVTAPVAEPRDVVARLAMPLGQTGGWADLVPWPGQNAGTATRLTALTNQTTFQITIPGGSAALPSGVTAPKMMAWNKASWRYEKLNVTSVTLSAGQVYNVVLSSAPSFTLAVNDVICPDTERRLLIAQTIEAYFDSLGPGEVVDLTTDTRGHRAFRFPQPNEEFPQRHGSGILTFLHDALGSGLADSTLETANVTPGLPSDPTAGPSMIVADDVGVYSL